VRLRCRLGIHVWLITDRHRIMRSILFEEVCCHCKKTRRRLKSYNYG
jgi:hypothetical protein